MDVCSEQTYYLSKKSLNLVLNSNVSDAKYKRMS